MPSPEQALFAHWSLAVHVLPLSSAVQPLVVHIAIVPLHVCGVPAAQVPLPSQAPPGVSVLPEHDGELHTTVLPG